MKEPIRHVWLPLQHEGDWIGESDGETFAYVSDHRNKRARTYQQRADAAALICQAVNAHDDLLKACEVALAYGVTLGMPTEANVQLTEAILKARGEG